MKNYQTNVKRIRTINKINKIMSVVREAVETFKSIDELTALNVFKLTVWIASKAAETLKNKQDVCDENGWRDVINEKDNNNVVFRLALRTIVNDRSFERLMLTDRFQDVKNVCFATIGKSRFGFTSYDHAMNNVSPIMTLDDVERAKRDLADAVFKTAKSNVIVVERSMTDKFMVIPWRADDAVSTSTIDAIAARLWPFIVKSITRCVALVGPPGTGKSVAAIKIAERFGMKCVRVSTTVSDDIGALVELIGFLRPDAVIVDDVDWTLLHGGLLNKLDVSRTSAKLFILTMNDASRLPAAVMRPGRVDEVFEFSAPDRALVERIVGHDEDPNDVNVFLGWPLAFVKEYVIRRDTLGRDAARASIQELNDRAKAALASVKNTAEESAVD